MEEVIAVVGVFGSLPLIIWLVIHYRFKAKAKSAEIVQAMIANDKEITPELIKSVGFTPTRRHGDLRTGLILLAIGIAFFIFGGMIPEDEAQAVFAGIASFPILIAIAMIAFWYFVSRKDQD
jgi:ABC-type transport system involved in cytochrome c biogenesis permease subunit